MKNSISLALVMIMAFGGFAKEKNAATAKHTTVTATNISVSYSQPSLNGRTAFGFENNVIAQYGHTWAVGNNDAATVTITKDCLIGGNGIHLKAGTYSLFVKPAVGEWIFHFAPSNIHTAAAFDKNASSTLARSWGLVKPAAGTVDKLTITPQDGGLQIEWDNTSVLLPIKFTQNN